MKRCIGFLQLIILALVVGLGVACRGKTTASPTPTPSGGPSVPSAAAEGETIVTRGIIRPAQMLQLGFVASGPLRAVQAYLGMEVKTGDLLAELDTTTLEFALQSARESVALRQAELDALRNGPDPTLIAREEAEHAQQVSQAEITLQMAGWRLEQARLQEQRDNRDHAMGISLAQSRLEQLDRQLAQARALSPSTEVVVARVGLARARAALEAARVEYQKAVDRPWEPQEVRDAYSRAVWLAEQELELAQARLEGAQGVQRAHGLGLEVLSAQQDAATIQLTQTLASQVAFSTTFALLQAEVVLAQLQLDGLVAWQNPYLDLQSSEEIARARALLRQAELVVEEMEWQLEGAQLRAPFDGVISAVYTRPSEWSAAGSPVVELLDTTRWRVETRNVGELDIGRVHIGQEALVQVNAFAGQTLRGRVAAISPVAVVQQGDTTFTLTIELAPTELNLRPGMTVQAEILADPDATGS